MYQVELQQQQQEIGQPSSCFNEHFVDQIDECGIEVANIEIEEIFPRLGSYDAAMARAWDVIDNLDEVMIQPQGLVFPLHVFEKRPMRRRIEKLENADKVIFHKHSEIYAHEEYSFG